MLTKTLSFNKIQKTVDVMEKSLNEHLKTINFKYATQCESQLKGKILVSIYGDKGKGTVRAKVFKDQMVDHLDDKINEFLKKNSMKFVTQTCTGSNMIAIVFYDTKADDKSPDDKNQN